MHRTRSSIKIDPSIQRVVVQDFHFPLGVYPVETMEPKAGFTSNFESADGGGEGDWEEWPDRYAYDVVLSAERVPAFCRTMFSLFEGRIYPILDILGQDGYREVDPYIAYEMVGLDGFLEGVRLYQDWLYEDGMCGFGLLTEEPFLYVFLDEHKIATIRCEPSLRERVEKVLAAFDLEQTEHAAGADASAHEHRSVLLTPANHPQLLAPEEVLDDLRRRWRLLLNVDPDSNVDEEGHDLGTTSWRAIVRCEFGDQVRYAEVVFDADNLRQAEEVVFSACDELTAEFVVPKALPAPQEPAQGQAPNPPRTDPAKAPPQKSEPASPDPGKARTRRHGSSPPESAQEQDAEPTDDQPDASIMLIDRLRPEQLKQVLQDAGLMEGPARAGKGRGKAGKSAPPAQASKPKAKAPAPSALPTPAAGHVHVARWIA